MVGEGKVHAGSCYRVVMTPWPATEIHSRFFFISRREERSSVGVLRRPPECDTCLQDRDTRRHIILVLHECNEAMEAWVTVAAAPESREAYVTTDE